MTVETTLITRLEGVTALTNLVSTRIYPNKLPQNPTFPAISYRRVSAIRESAFGADPGLVSARFQFDVWAETYSSAKSVSAEVRGALKRWSTTTGTTVEDIYMVGEIDLYEDETDIHHIALDFEIKYIET